MDKEREVKLIENLKRRRKEAHISQAAFANMIGMSKIHISSLERGKYIPSLDTLLSYCDYLNVSPNELLGYTDIIPRLSSLLENMDAYEQDKLCDIIELIQHQKEKQPEKQDEREPE